MTAKKWLLAANCILLIFSLAFMFLRPQNYFPISCPVGDEKGIGEILEHCVETRDELLSGLTFAGQQLSYEEGTSTFYLPVDTETESWETGGFTAGDSSVMLLFSDAIRKADKRTAAEESRKFPFWALRGHQYRKYYVMLQAAAQR